MNSNAFSSSSFSPSPCLFSAPPRLRGEQTKPKMKILDRYVISTFLKNYIISLGVLIGLYVVMDMVFNFDEILNVQSKGGAAGIGGVLTVVRDAADFYFYQSFLIFVQMSGIIPVVAAAFTLLRFSRFSELTAFLAAGVPLLRVAAPIILASVFLNGLLVIDQEWVLPRMIPKLTRKHDEVRSATSESAFRISAMQVGDHSLLLAAVYRPGSEVIPPIMEEMDVLERDDDLQPTAHVMATKAIWDEAHQQWNLINGRRVTGLLPTQQNSPEIPIDVFKGDVTPEEIALYHSSSFVELLSTRRIDDLIAKPKSYGANSLYKVKFMRATQPFMNVILLLLAIPTVLTHDPKSLKRAASKCLLLTGLAMGSVFIFQQVASNPPLGPQWAYAWPMLLAWMPLFIFGPLAVWLMSRVRS